MKLLTPIINITELSSFPKECTFAIKCYNESGRSSTISFTIINKTPTQIVLDCKYDLYDNFKILKISDFKMTINIISKTFYCECLRDPHRLKDSGSISCPCIHTYDLSILFDLEYIRQNPSKTCNFCKSLVMIGREYDNIHLKWDDPNFKITMKSFTLVKPYIHKMI